MSYYFEDPNDLKQGALFFWALVLFFLMFVLRVPAAMGIPIVVFFFVYSFFGRK